VGAALRNLQAVGLGMPKLVAPRTLGGVSWPHELHRVVEIGFSKINGSFNVNDRVSCTHSSHPALVHLELVLQVCIAFAALESRTSLGQLEAVGGCVSKEVAPCALGWAWGSGSRYRLLQHRHPAGGIVHY